MHPRHPRGKECLGLKCPGAGTAALCPRCCRQRASGPHGGAPLPHWRWGAVVQQQQARVVHHPASNVAHHTPSHPTGAASQACLSPGRGPFIDANPTHSKQHTTTKTHSYSFPFPFVFPTSSPSAPSCAPSCASSSSRAAQSRRRTRPHPPPPRHGCSTEEAGGRHRSQGRWASLEQLPPTAACTAAWHAHVAGASAPSRPALLPGQRHAAASAEQQQQL